MAELVLTVSGRHLALPQNVPEQITNTEFIDAVRFECDSQYNGYELVAVFKNGEHGTPYPVAVPHDRSAVSIDPRALRRKGWLYVGMYGLDGLKVLPTLWASAIEIKDGTDTSGTENPDEPVPSIYAALVARVGALEDAVDDLEDDIDDLEGSVGDLETAVDQLGDTVTEIEGDVADLQTSKQDVITDLDTIRSGAAAGATALQSVPLATSNTIGGAKINANGYYGIGVDSNGMMYINRAGNGAISARNNAYTPITPANMDTAFRTCITSPAQELTDEQKAAACATIGATPIGGGEWESVVNIEGAGRYYVDMTGYTEMIIFGTFTATDSHGLISSNDYDDLVSLSTANGTIYAHYKNELLGMECINAVYGGYNSTACRNKTNAYSYFNGYKIENIESFFIWATTLNTCNIAIYAR